METKYLPLTIEQAQEFGYSNPKILSTGECAGIMPLIFTVGLFVGLDESGYRTRFCYETWNDAESALASWNGHGDPPGNWIKEKGGAGGDRMNPNYRRTVHGSK